jgi:AcrR family transcriptional regulator
MNVRPENPPGSRSAARRGPEWSAIIFGGTLRANLPSAMKKKPSPYAFRSKELPKGAERLLTTAERLYGQHGLDGVSLRQIGIAANHGNKYAVQHYFGSKLGLIQAVSEMRLPVLETERRRLLVDVHRDGDYSVHRLLGTLLSPLVTQLDDLDLQHYARFTLSVMRLEEHLHPFVKSADISPGSMEIHGRLNEALSQLPHDVFRRRLSLSCSLFLSAASHLGGRLILSRKGYPSRAQFFRDTFGASVAVLNAPYPPPADNGLLPAEASLPAPSRPVKPKRAHR